MLPSWAEDGSAAIISAATVLVGDEGIEAGRLVAEL